MPTALDRLRDRKKANHRDIPVCMNPDLVAQRERLQGEVSRLRARAKINSNNEQLDGEISDLEEELADLNQDILADSEWIRIKALAPDDYQKLVDEHPPTKDDLRQARKVHGPRASLPWNPDTFPNAILAASAYVLTVKEIDPKTGKPVFEPTEDSFTEEFVAELRESGQWSGGEVMALVSAAVNINESVTNIGAAGNG